jgi:hypothetical protein
MAAGLCDCSQRKDIQTPNGRDWAIVQECHACNKSLKSKLWKFWNEFVLSVKINEGRCCCSLHLLESIGGINGSAEQLKVTESNSSLQQAPRQSAAIWPQPESTTTPVFAGDRGRLRCKKRGWKRLRTRFPIDLKGQSIVYRLDKRRFCFGRHLVLPTILNLSSATMQIVRLCDCESIFRNQIVCLSSTFRDSRCRTHIFPQGWPKKSTESLALQEHSPAVAHEDCVRDSNWQSKDMFCHGLRGVGVNKSSSLAFCRFWWTNFLEKCMTCLGSWANVPHP